MNINNNFELQLNSSENLLFCGNFDKEIEIFDMITGKLINKSKKISSCSSLHSFCYENQFSIVNDQLNDYFEGENNNLNYYNEEGFWISTPSLSNPLQLSFFPLYNLFSD